MTYFGWRSIYLLVGCNWLFDGWHHIMRFYRKYDGLSYFSAFLLRIFLSNLQISSSTRIIHCRWILFLIALPRNRIESFRKTSIFVLLLISAIKLLYSSKRKGGGGILVLCYHFKMHNNRTFPSYFLSSKNCLLIRCEFYLY